MSDWPDPNIENIPTADVSIHTSESGTYQTESFPIKTLKTNYNDYMVTLKKSLLERIYNKLEEANKIPLSWDEFSIIIFSASSSASLTAALSPIGNIKDYRVLFFTILPIIAASSIVFTIMFKFYRHKIKNNQISEILLEIKPIHDSIKKNEEMINEY